MVHLDGSMTRRRLLASTAAGVTSAALARSIAAQTPVATPVAAGFAPFVDRLGDLLAFAPAESEATGTTAFTFADLERQLAATGMPRPSSGEMPEQFPAVVDALPLAPFALRFAFRPEVHETFGFEPLQVGRLLEFGEPPESVAVYAGGFDPDRVRSALLAAGYQEIDQETGGSYLTFGDEIDLESPVGRLGVGNMNQAAIRGDTVIFTRSEARIQQVTQVIEGYAPSVVEQGAWPDLMATFASDVVGVYTLNPATLGDGAPPAAIQQLAFGVREGADDRDLRDAEDAGEEIPGATAIEDMSENRARVQVRIRYVDEETAQSEVAAIPERWTSMASEFTNQPLTDMMLVEDAYAVDGDPTIAAIDFRVNGPSGWWQHFVVNGDLAPFVPEA